MTSNMALRSIVSHDIFQSGSLVRPDRFRFGFAFSRALAAHEMAQIEDRVNDVIARALPVYKHADVPIDEAKKMGAMAIFGEKYGDKLCESDVGGFDFLFE